MIAEVKPPVTYTAWVISGSLLIAGVALLLSAATTHEPEAWRWVAGGVATLAGGWGMVSAVRRRMRTSPGGARPNNPPGIVDRPGIIRFEGGLKVFIGGTNLAVQGGIWYLARNDDYSQSGWPVLIALNIFGLVGGLLLLRGVAQIVTAWRLARPIGWVCANGVRATAVVLTLRQLRSGGHGHDPTVRIGLQVAVPGHEPWRAATDYRVSSILMPRVQPGAVLAVIADASVPDVVVVDWSRAL